MQLRTCLVNSIESNLKFYKLKVIFQSPCKLDSSFRYKDSLEKKIPSNIVDTRLVTARLLIMVKHTVTFFTRVAEHMGISNLTGERLKSVKQSTVSDHLLECNCSIDFDHFDMLVSDANKFRLLIKEGLLI